MEERAKVAAWVVGMIVTEYPWRRFSRRIDEKFGKDTTSLVSTSGQSHWARIPKSPGIAVEC